MKVTKNYVFFYGGILSQWHPCKFQGSLYNQPGQMLNFSSAEQYMMANKAFLFDDISSLEKIMMNSHPSVAKQIGRKVKGFDPVEWDGISFQIVVTGNYYKFSQNDDLKETLLKTENKTLVEASPYDKIWGIGMNEYDPHILNPINWKGKNLLGKALMEVRAKL